MSRVVPGGDRAARARRRVLRAGAGRPARLPAPRWRAFGADAPPRVRSRKGGNDAAERFIFRILRAGGWRGARCRGRARSWTSTVDAPFCFRASGEHVPYGLVFFLRVEGCGRHIVTDRAKRRDARASFPRVRSDSLPAGQPSRVRGVPACLLAKRSTRLSASLLASARSPCAVVLCGVRAFRGDAKSVGQRKRSLCATVSES